MAKKDVLLLRNLKFNNCVGRKVVEMENLEFVYYCIVSQKRVHCQPGLWNFILQCDKRPIIKIQQNNLKLFPTLLYMYVRGKSPSLQNRENLEFVYRLVNLFNVSQGWRPQTVQIALHC
jgi:hypothetical protein